MIKWLFEWVKKKSVIAPIKHPPVTERNYMDDVVTLRTKLQSAGWKVRELPIRSNDVVKSWKIVAAKGDRSITIGGTTLDEALHNLARTVGVVANRALHS